LRLAGHDFAEELTSVKRLWGLMRRPAWHPLNSSPRGKRLRR
jgi:hypothetical protein